MLDNNSIVNNTNAGILLKETNEGIIQDNILSMNTFGLSLWNASYNLVRRNRADHNYYGILVTDSSNYNNITENVAEDNSRSEIVTGFGIRHQPAREQQQQPFDQKHCQGQLQRP